MTNKVYIIIAIPYGLAPICVKHFDKQEAVRQLYFQLDKLGIRTGHQLFVKIYTPIETDSASTLAMLYKK